MSKISILKKLPSLPGTVAAACETSKVFALLLLAMLASQGASAQEQTSINFRNAEISSLIESVAEITGKSFVIDPRVRGNVTIIAPGTIDSDMLYEAFLSALQVQGFQAIEDGAIVRIVPFNQAFGVLGGGDNALETRLIKVNYVDATALVPAVRPLLNASARIQSFAESNYLVVTDIRSNVERLVELVNELDDPSQNAIEVINLEHITPAEAVYIVSQLQQIQQRGLSVVEDSLNNRIIISGPATVRADFKNMLRTLDVSTARGGDGVEIIFLNYAQAVNLKPIIDSVLQSSVLQDAGSDTAGQSFKVEVDESNNALVVAATPDVLKTIKLIVDRLDRIKPQVLIEVIIAQLSEDQAERLSTQLVYSNRDSGAILTSYDDLLTSLIGAAIGAGNDLTSALGQVEGGVFGGGNFDDVSGEGIGVLVQALKSDTSTRVLSTPSIVTLDNEEAELSVGREVPFITGSFLSNGDSSNNPFQTINREDVGIKLTVTPQIGEGGIVRLTIDQELSSIINSASAQATADVVTSKSTILTNVMVRDRGVLVLGGLIDSQFENADRKVPLLGDIPIFGRLFRSSSESDEQKVLMMFIRPTILTDMESAIEVSGQRFDYLINHDLSGDEDSDINILLKEFTE